jgi:small subunit ribosomal protein S16
MSVKIRLRRTGRKKQPSYRLVATDSASPRDGQYLEALGTYNPLVKPADLRIDMEKVDRWIAQGAEMSDTAASLIRKARLGGDAKVSVRAVEPDPVKEKVETVVAAKEPTRSAPRAGSRGAPKADAPADVVAAAASIPTAEAVEDKSVDVSDKAPEASVDADYNGPRGVHVEPQDPAIARGEAAEDTPALGDDNKAEAGADGAA